MKRHLDFSDWDMRPRLLVLAHHFDQLFSMESRLAWQRAVAAAADYDVTVICEHRGDLRPPAGVRTVALRHSLAERVLMSLSATYYFGYRLWQRRVRRLAERLHRRRPFALVHHVSYCGFREPGECWRLGAPFIWGPIGGTSSFPWRFLTQIELTGAVRESLRNIVNVWQLRFDRRVRQAADASATLLAANRTVAAALVKAWGRTMEVQLETGVSLGRATPRPPRRPDQPLRILWAGRLRSWKGLPLLLRALAQVSPDCPFQLRVLGEGCCLKSWQRLARRLGIADRIEWVGWTHDYRQQLPHYDWADVFAFTSLRDTSGTGLLEALAAGAPIIGVDHQGAADIMTADCAIATPVTTPRETIAGFVDAIERLQRWPEYYDRLSLGALARARRFNWDRQRAVFRRIYSQGLAGPAAESRPAAADCRPPLTPSAEAVLA